MLCGLALLAAEDLFHASSIVHKFLTSAFCDLHRNLVIFDTKNYLMSWLKGISPPLLGFKRYNWDTPQVHQYFG